MDIVVVDLGDIGIGYDDERQVSKSLNSMGESGGEERQGEIGR